MSFASIGRRGLVALGAVPLLAGLVLAGPAAAIPRMDPAACQGQPELTPLEPLKLVTQRGTHSFRVEIADSVIEREYGLMCRKSLAADRGMLFIFPKSAPQAFWMRNTLIPLDIIYIGTDGKVVSIARNARPLDETPLPSGGPAIAVLELAGGRAAQLGLLPGDKVVHRAFK
ncbi:conserved hypothetical protein [Phenylobacterium zucineum HLK1]|uniref:DUF192 domain-containing protein n=1 Tax=Phenylobacterium zucineum (strain HLK1) TaxID=450851 RepID=B4RAZ8_PHEZH|nr:DUF192 domain-containing protein [Phenylobacterium zucineum]ACG78049.1 conserved hypothetical protein [Phenylobacterium zucineum HLK1]